MSNQELINRLILDDKYRNKIKSAVENNAISIDDAIYFEDNKDFKSILEWFNQGYSRRYILNNFNQLINK